MNLRRATLSPRSSLARRLVSSSACTISATDTSDKVSVQLRTERARSNEMEAVILDMEATLSQFRDLVSSLQMYVQSGNRTNTQ